MAYKNIFRLTARRQGEVVGQVYRLINCYGEFFVPRSRSQVKEIGKDENAIYWVENSKTNEVTAVAIVEKTYNFNITQSINLSVLGHTIAKVGNQMNNVLDHLMGDYQDQNLLAFSKDIFAQALQLEERYDFICLDIKQMQEYIADFASSITDYFSSSCTEKITDAMLRKNYNIYLKLTPQSLDILKKENVNLYNFIKKQKNK